MQASAFSAMESDDSAALRQQLQEARLRAEEAECRSASLEEAVRLPEREAEQYRVQHRLQLLEAKEEVPVRLERLIDEAIQQGDTVRRESEVVIQHLTDQPEEKSQQVEQLKRIGEDKGCSQGSSC